MRKLESWGRYPRVQQSAERLHWRSDPLPQSGPGTVLPFGNGRSYGDVCLNDGGTLLCTRGLDRFISFDAQTGVLCCEAGMTLGDILERTVPRGWFLPVTPGTQHVTVGGAIANDVHGKNHHRTGTFGRWVRRLELLRSDGQRLSASPHENADWFAATVGGLGLTGLILAAELQLRPIASPFVFSETLSFRDLDGFFEHSHASDARYEYTVAWLDCISSGKHFGRGLFFRGNHAEIAEDARSPRLPSSSRSGFKVPFDFPSFVLNPYSIRTFNGFCYQFKRRNTKPRLVSYDRFFYPLDRVQSWNRIYGRRGLFQFQCVVPATDGQRPLRTILEEIVRSGLGSFLAVLKTFGDLPSPGMMSFPRPGVTLALDFANHGEETLALLRALDRFTREMGGAVYPAKDAVMAPESFQAYFPQYERFATYVDPAFSSSFWRRVHPSAL